MKKSVKLIKFLIIFIVICLLVWFFIISPSIIFHKNENKMRNAAKRYYEINSSSLPTGKRVKTLTLSELYDEKYLDGDFYVPHSSTLCDQTNSWVKVRRNSSGDYDYIVFLDCKSIKSNVDHEGPTIKLNGKSDITIGVGDKYKDPGIRSVSDNSDGNMSTKSVTIKENVDTSKVGTYKIEYSAFDSLKNRSVTTRTVRVIKQIKSVVKKELGNSSNYTGTPSNNYVRLSNIIFRIYGIDTNDNIILVAGEDISNINYTKLNDWLNGYFYKHLNKLTKSMIVKNRYCNMTLTDTTLDSTECSNYTDKVNIYVPSVIDINKVGDSEDNFMRPSTMSWTANSKDKNNAYAVRNLIYSEDNKRYISYDSSKNYGVRPMFTIKGTSNIKGGDGSLTNPYTFGDSKKVEGGSNANRASTGEYIRVAGELYRVIDKEKGYLKIIAEDAITNEDEPVEFSNDGGKSSIYNPTKKDNVGYFINNRVNDYIDTSYFDIHNVSVPIYKSKIIYGTETSTKKYKVKLFAPNMYELFSAQSTLYGRISYSYWLINSSNNKSVLAAITDIGVPVSDVVPYFPFGVRPCAYLKKNVVITSGSGTHEDPYEVK